MGGFVFIRDAILSKSGPGIRAAILQPRSLAHLLYYTTSAKKLKQLLSYFLLQQGFRDVENYKWLFEAVDQKNLHHIA